MNGSTTLLTKLDDLFFERLLVAAKLSARKRAHRNLHADFQEPVQRVCIALVKGTYVRPHSHPQGNKRELILPMKGRTTVLIFDAQGRVLERLTLGPGEVLGGVEIPPGVWHTVFPLTETSVVLEVKQGPYVPSDPVSFAEWAPQEGAADVPKFLEWAMDAPVGGRRGEG